MVPWWLSSLMIKAVKLSSDRHSSPITAQVWLIDQWNFHFTMGESGVHWLNNAPFVAVVNTVCISRGRWESKRGRDTVKNWWLCFVVVSQKDQSETLWFVSVFFLRLTHYTNYSNILILVWKLNWVHSTALQFSNDTSASLTVDGRLTATFSSVFHWDVWLQKWIPLIRHYYVLTADMQPLTSVLHFLHFDICQLHKVMLR